MELSRVLKGLNKERSNWRGKSCDSPPPPLPRDFILPWNEKEMVGSLFFYSFMTLIPFSVLLCSFCFCTFFFLLPCYVKERNSGKITSGWHDTFYINPLTGNINILPLITVTWGTVKVFIEHQTRLEAIKGSNFSVTSFTSRSVLSFLTWTCPIFYSSD